MMHLATPWVQSTLKSRRVFFRPERLTALAPGPPARRPVDASLLRLSAAALLASGESARPVFGHVYSVFFKSCRVKGRGRSLELT